MDSGDCRTVLNNGKTLVTRDCDLVYYKQFIHEMLKRDYKYYEVLEVPYHKAQKHVYDKAKGETRLHYDVVEYVRKQYKNRVKILPGLGEHFATNYAAIDGCKKGYECGTPDLTLLSKRKNGSHDILCLELKYGNNTTSYKQQEYHKDIQRVCGITVHTAYTQGEAEQIIRDHYTHIDAEDNKINDMEQRLKQLELENKELKEQNMLLKMIAKTSTLTNKIIDLANILR